MKRKILRAWERRRAVSHVVSMPLPCFVEGDLHPQENGILSFERYSCSRDSDCVVLRELSQRRDDARRLMDTLSEQPERAENERRRQALRHVCRTPTKPFSDHLCRSLGDAVFAIMAPADAVILTTNLRDHAPLAAALGKTAAEP